MAQDIINPKDTTAMLLLHDVINEVDTGVGFIKNSGLFEETLSHRDTIVEQIKKADKRGMLGLTSRRERNKVKQTKRRETSFSLQIPYQETIEEVGKEDIQQVAKSWNDATEENIMDLYNDKIVAMKESIDNSHEYMYWTGAQGITRDPFDGSVVLDMFKQTGITRPVVNLDLTDASLNILLWMADFRNRVLRDNKRSNNEGLIEIFVTSEVYSKIINHPSVLATYQMAYNGTGKLYLDNLGTPFGTTRRGEYGIVSDFEWQGVRFVVAPQTFIFEDADDLEVEDAVAEDSGFAVVRGIRNVFKAVFTESNSLTDNSLSKYYAYRSPVAYDSYFEMTASSAPIAYTTAPELCYEFKFKTK